MQLSSAFRVLLCCVALAVPVVKAALYTEFSQLPAGVRYDFIIVGGGSAGNVVANRLTECSKVNVLVLEAGPSQEGVLTIQVPLLAPNLARPNPYDWNYTTVALPGLNGRSIPYPRGHVLGGSSSTNWMIHTRGSSEDWDRYAAVTGDDGWSWEAILPYFKKSERWGPPTDDHDTTGEFDPSVHGYDGVIGTTLDNYRTPVTPRAIGAAHELGGEYAFNLDHNDGSVLGIAYSQSLIKHGERSSSATGYLGPEYINRRNLAVLVGARVTRILKSSAGALPVFRGVEFRDPSGMMQQISARKEVILSAGSIGTPHILLNSGFGNPDELRALNITPLVDLPVGENLSDHPTLPNTWVAHSNDTYETYRRNPGPYLDEWAAERRGPYANTNVDVIGFGRNPDIGYPDPAAGPNTPHFEIVVTNGLGANPIPPPTGNFMGFATILVSPASRGSVKLASKDPFAAPLIDPGFYTDEEGKDVSSMRAAVRFAVKFAGAEAWKGYVGESIYGLSENSTDEEVDAHIKARSSTLFHPVGTAGMGPGGVVDNELRVRKVRGVRVVDVSVLPFVPSAHTCAPAYAVGERASDMIKAAYNLS